MKCDMIERVMKVDDQQHLTPTTNQQIGGLT